MPREGGRVRGTVGGDDDDDGRMLGFRDDWSWRRVFTTSVKGGLVSFTQIPFAVSTNFSLGVLTQWICEQCGHADRDSRY